MTRPIDQELRDERFGTSEQLRAEQHTPTVHDHHTPTRDYQTEITHARTSRPWPLRQLHEALRQAPTAPTPTDTPQAGAA